jgi:hypothetical protein
VPDGFDAAERRKFLRRAGDFLLHQGALFKRGRTDAELPRRVVTKRVEQLQLMASAHEGTGGGHFEYLSSYNKLKLKYYWQGMAKDVQAYVNGCEDCQRLRTRRFLEPVKPSKAPATIFLVWYVDPIVMPWSSDKKRFLLHAVCALTGWPELKAFTRGDAVVWMDWLVKNVFYRYSFPVHVYADQSSISSVEARAIYQRLGIPITIIAPHNHKALGVVERAHAPVVGAIARYSRSNPKNWTSYVDLAAFAVRVMANATGYSPFYMVFGQHPLMHLDFAKGSFEVARFWDGMSTVELLEARMRQLECRAEDVARFREVVSSNRERGARLLNEKIKGKQRARPLVPGDLVLLHDTNLHGAFHKKLADVWMGPYVVEGVRDGGTYLLRELNGKLRRRAETGDRLKLWIPPVVNLVEVVGGEVELGEDTGLFCAMLAGPYQDLVEWDWGVLLRLGSAQSLTLVSKDCYSALSAGVEMEVDGAVVGGEGSGCCVVERWGKVRCNEFWGLLESGNAGGKFVVKGSVIGEGFGQGSAVSRNEGWNGKLPDLESATGVDDATCQLTDTSQDAADSITQMGFGVSVNGLLRQGSALDGVKSRGVFKNSPRSNCDHLT